MKIKPNSTPKNIKHNLTEKKTCFLSKKQGFLPLSHTMLERKRQALTNVVPIFL